MLKSLSVKIRLIGFIVFLLLLFLLSGIFGLKGMRNSNQSLSDVFNYQVIPLNELRTLDNLMNIGVIKTVDKLLFEQSTWEECLVNVTSYRDQIKDRWQTLHDIHTKGEQNDWLKPAALLLVNSENTLNSLIVLLQSKSTAQLDTFTDNKLYPLGNKYSEVIDNLIQKRLNAVEHEYIKSQSRYSRAKSTFLMVLIAGLFISCILSWMIIISIDKPLNLIIEAMEHLMQGDIIKDLPYDQKDEFGFLVKGFNQMTSYLSDLISEIERSGIQVTSSITEIAATIKQQETTVNEQAATSNEIAASTTEIAATAESLMSTMSNVTDMAKNTATAASQGHSRLTNINSIMKKMEDSTVSIVTKLSILSEKATNIAGVTKTINKIADQTNLLSLNAAIEAEKAGEYGTGFSVVSSEIRRLADQTAVATFDIEQMVNEVQSAVASGVMNIEKFADDVRKSFSEIQISSLELSDVIQKVQAIRPPIETVNEGIAAQSFGAKQISEAVSQLNEAAQQNADSVGQTSTTIFQLNKAALILRDSVLKFQIKDHKNTSSYYPGEP